MPLNAQRQGPNYARLSTLINSSCNENKHRTYLNLGPFQADMSTPASHLTVSELRERIARLEGHGRPAFPAAGRRSALSAKWREAAMAQSTALRPRSSRLAWRRGLRQGAVVHHAARLVRAGAGAGRIGAGPRNLCRGRRRQDRPGLHGGRAEAWRPRRRGCRNGPFHNDSLAPAPTRGRGQKHHRHRVTALALPDRGGGLWTADSSDDALARLGAAINAAAWSRRRATSLACRTHPRSRGVPAAWLKGLAASPEAGRCRGLRSASPRRPEDIRTAESRHEHWLGTARNTARRWRSFLL